MAQCRARSLHHSWRDRSKCVVLPRHFAISVSARTGTLPREQWHNESVHFTLSLKGSYCGLSRSSQTIRNLTNTTSKAEINEPEAYVGIFHIRLEHKGASRTSQQMGVAVGRSESPGRSRYTENQKRAHGVDHHVQDVPKQVQEPEYLHQEPNERPFEEYKQNPPQEAQSSSNLLFPREEVESLLPADDECQATQEKNLL